MRLRSFIIGDLLYAAVLGAALVALGIGFSLTSSTGEQSKLAYEGNLWCISNYIEQEPTEYLADGRPRKDERLDDKIDWIRKEQIAAESKEEAEQKATSQYFKPSNAEELRGWLDANNKASFTTHFNTGATTPGPCLGSGFGNGMAGKWVNDGLNEDCFTLPSGSGSALDIYNAKAFTAEQINTYLQQKSPNSPLNSKGQVFVDAGLKYGVNPGFLLGIADAESSLGIQCQTPGNLLNGTNNAFGLTAGGQTSFRRFGSYEEGIVAAASNAATEKYKQLDGSIKEFRLKWCGYETESENSGTILSDGTKITYDCKNGSSSWEAEVQAVLSGLSSISQATSDTEAASPEDISAKQNRPDYCPDKPLPAGPSTGEDYQLRIAKQYEQKLSEVYGEDSDGTSGATGGSYDAPTDLTKSADAIVKIAKSQVGYRGKPGGGAGKHDCTKYDACQQWCAYFVTWVYKQAGYDIPSIGNAQETLNWFKIHGHYVFQDVSSAAPGDIIVWDRGGKKGHIAIIVENNKPNSTLTIIEGNTGNDTVKEWRISYSSAKNNYKGLVGLGRWKDDN